MRNRAVGVIAAREYLSRIKSTGFWLATLALPLVMAVLMVLPSLVLSRTQAKEKLALVDTTGRLGPLVAAALEADALMGFDQATFDVEQVPVESDEAHLRAELDRRVLDDEISAWVWLSEDGLAEDRVEYHSESVANFLTQEVLAGKVSNAVRAVRLQDAGYDVAAIGQLSRPIGLDTVRISAKGSKAEGGFGALALAVALFVMLYTMILVYGAQVMLGVLEEKTNRVVEVMLSAVSSSELMTGKLVGIFGVALTQLGIWVGTAAVLLSPGLITLSFLPDGVELPTLPAPLVAHFFGYFLLGFFLYAAFYAMVGAAFNNQQDAQQMSSIGVIFVVAPWMVFLPILNDPDSPLAVVMSLIPFFTPMLMPLRMAVEMPPIWQIALSYLLTIGACALMIWLASRIYRVGILMYGKRPSPREIWKWVRQS